ncbi:MAG: hypothetical protein BWX88_05215 [Planctomycetes bacterium ADurb.Bin126]|nr:MAG: hypothetical protein BWX88_05215 [Planctomycetes bacterium ADurb.Bin126]
MPLPSLISPPVPLRAPVRLMFPPVVSKVTLPLVPVSVIGRDEPQAALARIRPPPRLICVLALAVIPPAPSVSVPPVIV